MILARLKYSLAIRLQKKLTNARGRPVYYWETIGPAIFIEINQKVYDVAISYAQGILHVLCC